MLDDPRIKRVLKRYPKDEPFFDAAMDLSRLGDAELLRACRCQNVDSFATPKELDDYATAHLGQALGIELDRVHFDYFIHSYVRSECVSDFFTDPSVTSKPPPEYGPPSKTPLPKGMEWYAVRPKDGREHYEAYPTQGDEESG